MKVLVFVKQVPDVNEVRFDPVTNRILREGVPRMMNSFDKKAVEEAVRLKERLGVETVVASMGPPQAAEVINEAMRMGIERGYLITDRKFGGADTLATSTILTSFASQIKPDLILTGKYSLDGETSQVPAELAVKLAYNFKSSVSKLEVRGEEALIEHENEFGLYNMRVKLPAVFSVSEKINRARPIKPDVPDYTESIITVDSSTLKIESNGVDMSQTVVSGTRSMESPRRCEFLDPATEVFYKVMSILDANLTHPDVSSKMKKPDYDPGRQMIVGVALDDPQISLEIASKISSLALSHDLNSVMIGNIEPEGLKGMPTSVYYYLPSKDTYDAFGGLMNFINENHPEYVIFPSTTRGREIAGMIAGEMNLGLTADCVDLEIKDGKLIQYKPSFGGSIIATIYSKTKPAMSTVRPGMFKTVLMEEELTVKNLQVENTKHEEILSFTTVPGEFLPLRSRKIVIGIGRGAAGKETIDRVLHLANLFGASVGASRPVVDMGLIPRQQQIGLTGSSISPDVYIALGISGKANHVVGTRYCKKVVAVNTDPKALIFDFADYGIVMDATSFVDGMIGHLTAAGSGSP